MEPDGPSANPRRAAMENYGARPDVHDLLSRFMTDLLCTQPDSKFNYHKLLKSYIINTDFTFIQTHQSTVTFSQCPPS